MTRLTPNEIQRSPDAPIFDDTSIELLSELCFRRDDNPFKVDLVFAFSSSHGTAELATIIDNLLQGTSQKVFITGGIPPYADTPQTEIAESELVLRHIDQTKYPPGTFFVESSSRNTLENVTEALKVLDFSNYERVLFIFKSHAAGRGYLTLKQFLSPNTHIYQKTWAPVYDGKYALSKDVWFRSDFGRARVWGEFLRIKKYGERGDIAYPNDVRSIVENLYRKLGN